MGNHGTCFECQHIEARTKVEYDANGRAQIYREYWCDLFNSNIVRPELMCDMCQKPEQKS